VLAHSPSLNQTRWDLNSDYSDRLLGVVIPPPADANEVVEAYRHVMQLGHQPALLALSRQPLPTLDRSKYAPASGLARGAYVLADAPGGTPRVILIASGSEVSLAVASYEELIAQGIRARRFNAVVRDFRASATGLSRWRAAAQCDRAHRSRAGLGLWLGALRRLVWPRGRDEGIRRVGPAHELLRIWFRTAGRDRSRERADRQEQQELNGSNGDDQSIARGSAGPCLSSEHSVRSRQCAVKAVSGGQFAGDSSVVTPAFRACAGPTASSASTGFGCRTATLHFDMLDCALAIAVRNETARGHLSPLVGRFGRFISAPTASAQRQGVG
jgi:hypothetical protein